MIVPLAHMVPPGVHVAGNTTPTTVSAILDASGENVASLFTVPAEWHGAIVDRVGFWCVSSTSGEVVVGLKNLISGGVDINSNYGTAQDSSPTVVTSNTLHWVFLGASTQLTAGTKLAIMVKHAAGAATVQYGTTGKNYMYNGETPATNRNLGSFARDPAAPAMRMKTTNGVILTHPMFFSWLGCPSTAVSVSTTNPQDHLGGRFTFLVRSRVRAAYVFCVLNLNSSILLYGPDGASVLADWPRYATTNSQWLLSPGQCFAGVLLPTPLWVDAGTCLTLALSQSGSSALTGYVVGCAAELLAADANLAQGECVKCMGAPTGLTSWSPYMLSNESTILLSALLVDAIDIPPRLGCV